MRILPHHQDTGGFFVAVLEKVKALPWENNTENDADTNVEMNTETVNESLENSKIQENETSEVAKTGEIIETRNEGDRKRALNDDKRPWGPQRKKKRLHGYREDPFVFFKDDSEDVWSSIK